MGLFKSATLPFSQIADAVFMPFKTVFVVGLCWVINTLTYNGNWWVKWVALGMGIATVVALARGIKALLLLALVAWVGNKLYRRYGSDARQKFDDWVGKTQPDSTSVLGALRSSTPGAAPLHH